MGNKKVVYIAGPISGVEHYWLAFEKAEDDISAAGFVPLSPSRLPSDLENEQAMQICMAMINVADAVLLLPGWNRSVGAQLELAYCKYTGTPAVSSIDALKEALV